MHFEKLRLVGFKSFVDASDILIERGLTGVVGPNGCGKSNLVEALRWVMGENSYKNMRASGMDDVIFSGSAERPSRNHAEVTLYLDNKDRSAPPAYNNEDQLQVSRRITRDHGSTYRINGKEVRARDVQLLFADQSTGARSPSMVGQGRIGALIQAKPQARRALLEEAAGISGLHGRRHEAELRLNTAEQNLERLDDITAQLTRQIDNLKRQARQAERFRNVSAQMRRTEAALFLVQWAKACEQLETVQTELSQSMLMMGEAAKVQAEAAKAQAISAHHLPSIREEEAKAAARLTRIKVEMEQLAAEAQRFEARAGELQVQHRQAQDDLAREDSFTTEIAATLSKLNSEHVELEQKVPEYSVRVKQAAVAVGQAQAELSQRQQAYDKENADRAAITATRKQAQKSLDSAKAEKERIQGQLLAFDRDIASVEAKLADAPDAARLRQQVELLESGVKQLEAKVLTYEEELSTAREREAVARTPVQAARTRRKELEAEAKTLRRILNSGVASNFTPVLEAIKAESGFEKALGAALGDELDSPLDVNAPAHWSMPARADNDPELPESVHPLADVVAAPPELTRRLKQIGIVNDIQTGARLQMALAPGQKLVTPDGDLWRWDGYVVRADAPSRAAERLEQKNQLVALETQITVAASEVEQCEVELNAATTMLTKIEADIRQLREQVRAKQSGLAGVRKALEAAEQATSSLNNRLAFLRQSREQTIASLKQVETALSQAMDTFEALPAIDALTDQLDATAAALVRQREELSKCQQDHNQAQNQAQLGQQRIAAIAHEIESWSARQRAASDHGHNLRKRIEKIELEIAEHAEQPADFVVRQRELTQKHAEAEKLRQQAADAHVSAQNRQRELDGAANTALQALAQVREDKARAEERLTAATERQSALKLRISQELECQPGHLRTKAELEQDAPLPEVTKLERQLERLRADRERIGAVNLRAAQEGQELGSELSQLTQEREDVMAAIRKLRQAVQQLNKEGRDRLLAAFDEVNTHFTELFTHLFGGGKAELKLIESDDPLEAGLEIFARPPGKRPQTMTLLSGGEQALTALALVFAVFLTNPAPICVLDEVDAPLDDQNVERFCNLLDQMTQNTKTRFLVITHNPITMARVNRLFGVTMAERGVSQLVSVDLDTAEKLREAG